MLNQLILSLIQIRVVNDFERMNIIKLVSMVVFIERNVNNNSKAVQINTMGIKMRPSTFDVPNSSHPP